MIYSKIGKKEARLQRELTASPTQLQSLHQKVMLTWEPTPNLNVCIIPWYHAVTIENSTQEFDRKEKPAWCFKKWETIFKDTVSWLLKDLSFKFFGGRKIWSFLSQKVDGNMIFTNQWKVLVLNYFWNGKYGLIWDKQLMERWYFSGIVNKVFFCGKKLMERWYLLINEKLLFWDTEKLLFWTFRWCEIRSFFSQNVDTKVVFTWSLWAFHDIPGPGKHGFLCSEIFFKITHKM